MEENQSLRIGSIINILEKNGIKTRAEVIGYVLGKTTGLRLQIGPMIIVRFDLENDDIELVKY